MSDIRWQYLRGMFLIDLAASMPTQYIDCIDSIYVPGIKLVSFVAQDKQKKKEGEIVSYRYRLMLTRECCLRIVCRYGCSGF